MLYEVITIFLLLQGLLKHLLGDRLELYENFADSDSILKMVGAADVPILKNQLALSLAAGDRKSLV